MWPLVCAAVVRVAIGLCNTYLVYSSMWFVCSGVYGRMWCVCSDVYVVVCGGVLCVCILVCGVYVVRLVTNSQVPH